MFCCSPFQGQIVVETMHLLSFAHCNVREDYTYPLCGLSLKVFMPGLEASDSQPSLSWQLHGHKTTEVTLSPEVFGTVSPVLVIGSMQHHGSDIATMEQRCPICYSVYTLY